MESSLGSLPFNRSLGTESLLPSALTQIENLNPFYLLQHQMIGWNALVLGGGEVQRGKEIGNGAGGKVYQGRLRGNVPCAIKQFKVWNESTFDKAMREIKFLSCLDHPCTVRLLGWIREPLQVGVSVSLYVSSLPQFHSLIISTARHGTRRWRSSRILQERN